MTITTRPATRADLPTLLAFEQGIIAAERPFDHTLKPDPVVYYDIGELIDRDDAIVVVAETNGQIVGSAYAKKRPSFHFVQSDYQAYLGFMYVSPDQRGKGINKIILSDLLAWAREHDLPEVHLTVYPGNESAIRAYEKAGFKPYITEMRLNLEE